MKEIPLTRGYVALVDDEDYEWLSQWRWYALVISGRPYAARGTEEGGKHRTVSMHRQIMNTPPGKDTDHIDNNGLNNRRSNLRVCTTSQNMMNKVRYKNNKSGYKGVWWSKFHQKWRSVIRVNKTHKHIGYFDTPIAAARAYDEAAREFFGEFAVLNFPDG